MAKRQIEQASSPLTISSSLSIPPKSPETAGSARKDPPDEACGKVAATFHRTERESGNDAAYITATRAQQSPKKLFISENTARAHVKSIYSSSACIPNAQLIDYIETKTKA